jgi:DNA-binding NarL/FixJ family response regulator
MVDLINRQKFAMADQLHDLVAAALSAGLTPSELRPMLDAAVAVRHDQQSDGSWTRLVTAQLDEADGAMTAAAEGYLAVAESFERSMNVMAGARGTVHVAAARTLAALGRLDDARDHVERAAVVLSRWRGWRVDELRMLERRLGVGPEPSGPDTLTPREREVAALLAEGLTNSQVAERLYISPRTAAVHVSNILSKLAMSSRAEVAAWAVREGLTAD